MVAVMCSAGLVAPAVNADTPCKRGVLTDTPSSIFQTAERWHSSCGAAPSTSMRTWRSGRFPRTEANQRFREYGHA